MLLSTSGTRTTLPPHTSDATPIKSKVAPRITAAQGIDYYSMVHTVPMSLDQEGHRCHTKCRTVIGTLYIVITVHRSRYTYVNTLISVYTFSFYEIPRKYILYPRALCLIIYS